MSNPYKLKVATLLAASVLVAPSVGQANTGYQSFGLTQQEIQQAASADYRRCVTLSGVNTSAQADCATAEQSLVDRRLAERHRAVLSGLSGSRAQEFRVNQQTWVRLRDQNCSKTWRRLLEANDLREYSKKMKQCILDESLKRIVWLERS